MNLLSAVVVYVRILFNLFIDLCFGFYFKGQRVYLSPITNKLLLESACTLAKKIKTREITAEKVVTMYIERTKEVNKCINALVDERFVDAIIEARKIDEDIYNGTLTKDDLDKKALLGVPFTIKESAASKGLRWTLGLLSRKNVVAEEDSEVVRLMKNAGAIQIGVTNVPQINFWSETYNPVYGRTNNPYNTTRNAGGSSGGEASLIAACGSPIGIGSDIGGSIRTPAHRCGIFGHKTIPNLISNKGQTFSKENHFSMNVIGPMAKRSEDLIPMLKILLNENINKLTLDDHVDLKKLNVYYIKSNKCPCCVPLQKDLEETVMSVVKHFENITGEKPVEIEFDDIKYAMKLWSYKLRLIHGTNFNFRITNQRYWANVPLEWIKYIIGKSQYNLYTLYNMLDVLVRPVDSDWIEKVYNRLKTAFSETLADNGILIFPSGPRSADYHYTMLLRPCLSYVCLWNALEFPVTQVPIGLNKDGLPTGVQIIASPYKDHLTLAAANEIENSFGGYVTPKD